MPKHVTNLCKTALVMGALVAIGPFEGIQDYVSKTLIQSSIVTSGVSEGCAAKNSSSTIRNSLEDAPVILDSKEETVSCGKQVISVERHTSL